MLLKSINFILIFVLFFTSVICADINDDKDFLRDIEKDSFEYFWNHYTNQTGLFRDRHNPLSHKVCSIAAVGFGLSVYCIAAEKNWKPYTNIYNRVLKTVDFFLNGTEIGASPTNYPVHKNGFFYHLIDFYTGEREGTSEISTIDSTLLFCGLITAGEYFGGEIKTKVEQILDRVDWNKFKFANNTISMGWKPKEDIPDGYTIPFEGGYLCTSLWHGYSEHFVLYLLAIASTDNMDLWHGWKSGINSANYTNGWDIHYSWNGALFTYQHPFCWINIKDKVDNTTHSGTNWWVNAINAVYANYDYCKYLQNNSDGGQGPYSYFGDKIWGLSDCNFNTNGGWTWYKPFGARPAGAHPTNRVNGTICIAASAASINHAPFLSIPTLREIKQEYPALYSDYGFFDSFNESTGYYDQDYVGLNQGATILSIENYLTGFIWDTFMKNERIQKALNMIFTDATNTLVSAFKPARSSTESGNSYTKCAFDNDPTTRWCSEHGVDPQWIFVDLGKKYFIGKIVIQWEGAYAKKYTIDVSDNGIYWTTIYSQNNNTLLYNEINKYANTRYVRMYGIERQPDGVTNNWGYSIWEFKIYRDVKVEPPEDSTPPVTTDNKEDAVVYNNYFDLSSEDSARIVIRKPGNAEIRIYNIMGGLVKSYSRRYYNAGEIEEWNGTIKDTCKKVGAGVYIVVIKGDNINKKLKMIIKK